MRCSPIHKYSHWPSAENSGSPQVTPVAQAQCKGIRQLRILTFVRFTRAAFLTTLLTLVAGMLWVTDPAAQTTYDAFGYDYQARRFFGLYENADRSQSNNTGDPTALQMEWSADLDLIHPELSPPGAWLTNFQKGTYVGQ